jgi:hypothetical protein
MMIGPSAPNGPPDPIEIADGERLQHGDTRLDAAAVDEDGFDRFGNAVAADAIRSVPRHQANDQRTDHWHDDDERTEMMRFRFRSPRRDALEKEDIRKERDQAKKPERDERADDPDADRECRDGEETRCGGEVAELWRDVRRSPAHYFRRYQNSQRNVSSLARSVRLQPDLNTPKRSAEAPLDRSSA